MKVFGWLMVLLLVAANVFFGFVLYDSYKTSHPDKASVEASGLAQEPSQEAVKPSPSNAAESSIDTTILNTEAEVEEEVTTSETHFAGQVFFTSDFDNYVESDQGNQTLQLIEETLYGSYEFLLAGSGADITVRNAKGEIIGLFDTDEAGYFDFKVPQDKFFSLEVLLREAKRTLNIKEEEAGSLFIDFGFYSNSNGRFITNGSFSQDNPMVTPVEP